MNIYINRTVDNGHQNDVVPHLDNKSDNMNYFSKKKKL